MLRHPYCRTCGSIIQDKNVCQSCGCEPLKGKYYCCDCGASTNPEAIMCVECGSGFQRKFPATLALLIVGALIVAIAGASYVISQSYLNSPSTVPNKNSSSIFFDSSAISTKIENKKSEVPNTIINHIPVQPFKKHIDTTIVVKNILPKNAPPKKPDVKQEAIKDDEINKKTNKEEAAEKPVNVVSTNIFSSGELRTYHAACSYYEGRSKSSVIFFTNNLFGYVKINGKLYELKGIEKGSDIAKFSGAGYEVTIEIEGLSGNENQWVASAAMLVKDTRQKILSRHRIYSSCTEF